jgi:hypothetical protein
VLRQLTDSARGSFERQLPLLVHLQAETGVGKTRIVHELYRALMASDRYWPEAIVAQNQRKAIYPPTSSSQGAPSIMWFGVPCGRESGGAPLAMLEAHVPRQLEAHCRGLLLTAARSKGRRAAVKTGVKAIAGLVGIGVIDELLDLYGHYEELRDIANDLKANDQATHVSPQVGPTETVNDQIVAAFVDIARLLSANAIPLVLAIEDAHDADATLLALVRRLLTEPMGVLIIATSWPTAINVQRERSEGFGALTHDFAEQAQMLDLAVPLMQGRDLRSLAMDRLATTSDRLAIADADRLATRAQGNPLHLMLLADVAEANEITLGEADAHDLDEMTSDFKEVLRGVWAQFLPSDVQAIALAAAILGTPTNDQLLLAAATEVTTQRAHRPSLESIDAAERLGWLLVDPDPYGDDRTVRFADPMFRLAAEDRAALVVGSRQRSACRAAIEVAVFPVMPVRHSTTGRLTAHMQARSLIERNAAGWSITLAYTPIVLIRLAEDLWLKGDLEIAAQVADRAAAAVSLVPSLPLRHEMIAVASRFSFAIGDHDHAVVVFDLVGDALLSQKARCVLLLERFDTAIDVGLAALRAEQAQAESLATLEWDDHSPVLESAHVVVEAATMLQNGDRHLEIAAAIEDAIISQHTRGNLDEATELCAWVSASEILENVIDRERIAASTGLKIPASEVLDLPSWDLSSAGVVAEIDALRQDHGHAHEAEHYLIVAASQHAKLALPLAHTLLEVGGEDYLDIVALIESRAGEHARAAASYSRLLQRELNTEPDDSDRLLDLRLSLVIEQARAGELPTARTEAKRLEAIAVARGAPSARVRARLAEATIELVAGRAAVAREVVRAAYADAHASGHSIWARQLDLLQCEASAQCDDWPAILDCVNFKEHESSSPTPPQVELAAWRWAALAKVDASLAVSSMLEEVRMEHLEDAASDAARRAVELFLADLTAALLAGTEVAETGPLALHTIGGRKSRHYAETSRMPRSRGAALGCNDPKVAETNASVQAMLSTQRPLPAQATVPLWRVGKTTAPRRWLRIRSDHWQALPAVGFETISGSTDRQADGLDDSLASLLEAELTHHLTQ